LRATQKLEGKIEKFIIPLVKNNDAMPAFVFSSRVGGVS
jgi:hypothetical protein